MHITFLRHATAQEYGTTATDFERQLIAKGERQVRTVAAFCRANGLCPELLLSSPYPRTLATAEGLQIGLPNCPAPVVVPWLGAEVSTNEMLEQLMKRVRAHEDVWVVGHEPILSHAVARLLGCDEPMIKIKKASLTRLQVFEVEGDLRAELLWSVPCGLMG